MEPGFILIGLAGVLVVSTVVALAGGRLLKLRAGPKGPVHVSAAHDVDLDILCLCESGGRCDARSPKGARGPFQLLPGAWSDALDWLAAHGSRQDWDYERYVEDPVVSRAIAWVYVNDVIPGYLTCKHLHRSDVTGPVPDRLEMRLAAYNAGALRVRQAFVRRRGEWFLDLPAETRRFVVTYRQLAAEKENDLLKRTNGKGLPHAQETEDHRSRRRP